MTWQLTKRRSERPLYTAKMQCLFGCGYADGFNGYPPDETMIGYPSYVAGWYEGRNDNV